MAGAVDYPICSTQVTVAEKVEPWEGKLLLKNQSKSPSQFEPDTGFQCGVLTQISVLGNY